MNIPARAESLGVQGPQAHKDLRTRVTEHNILVISAYYTRLRMERLSQLLDLTPDQVQLHLSIQAGRQEDQAVRPAADLTADPTADQPFRTTRVSSDTGQARITQASKHCLVI